MRSSIKKFIHVGVYATMPFIYGGYYEEEAGIVLGSSMAECYYAYTRGEVAESSRDPWLRAVVENYDRYERMSGERLIDERMATAPGTYERKIIDWILVYIKNYPYERIQELTGETRATTSVSPT